MNKKLKIVSSIALAGMLVTSSLGVGKVFANSTSDYITNPVGIYNKLVEGKSVVPFVLADKDDKLTVKDVTESDLFSGKVRTINGTAVADQNELVGTGDVIKTTEGKEYTVVLYGDVNGDGSANANDALQILKYATQSESVISSDVQKLAADISGLEDENGVRKLDGKINSLDAQAINKFVAKLDKDLIEDLPAPEEEEVDSIYTVSVNDNGYINSENYTTTSLKIELDETFDEEKNLSIKVTGIDKTTKEETEETKTIVIPAHTDYVDTSKLNTPVTFDFSNYENGVIKIEILDGQEVVAKANAEKNTDVPVAANVRTDRTSTKSATLSLEACGDSDIVKVYYLVSTTKPSPEEKLVNTIDVTGNKVSNYTITSDLSTNEASKVWYVLENSYGSKSEMTSAVITKDDNTVTTPEAVEEVVAPDLTKSAVADFTWTGVNGANYVATLYKDGKPVSVATSSNGITSSGTNFTATFTDKMKEAGTYKVEVYQEATDDSKASASTPSAEVKVEKLSAVTDLQFRNEDGKVMLSWENANANGSFKDYNIQLYTIDKDGKEVKDDKVTLDDNTKTEVEVTSNIDNNVIYIAKVTVNADNSNQMAMINSDEVTSAQFYKVGTPEIDSTEISEHEITLNVTGVNINGKTTTYKVKVFDVNSNPEVANLVLKDTKDVEIKDGKIVIDGLESNKPYAFKLIAIVDGEEVESDYTAKTIDDAVYTLPELKNLTVVATEEEAKESGKVYSVDADIIKIAGEKEGELTTIDLADYNNSTRLANSLKVINKLKAGDVVTIENNKITLKLDGGASVSSDQFRDFSELTDLKDVVFDIENNGYSKTIKTPTEGVKEVILRGTDSLFNTEEVNAEKITLTDGVDVTGNKAYTIESGATVTINGVEINASNEMKLSASGKNITVDVKGSSSNDAEFTFENTTTDDVTITFDGDETLTAQQLGTIKITSVGGKVTVLSSNVSVKADIKVEVNKGTVDISAPALTGNKEVSVTADKDNKATVVAVSKTDAPEAVINYSYYDEENMTTVTAFELKDYTDKELADMFDLDEEKDKDQIIAIDNYISSFGLNGTGATLDVEEGNVVTITLTSSVDKIENLK